MKTTPLEVCKKYYHKVYNLYTKGNDECKRIAYHIYYTNYGTTYHEDIADFCRTLGLRVVEMNDFGTYYKISH